MGLFHSYSSRGKLESNRVPIWANLIGGNCETLSIFGCQKLRVLEKSRGIAWFVVRSEHLL